MAEGVHSNRRADPRADATAGRNRWSRANLAPMPEPTPRFSYAMAEVTGENRVIVFGGQLQNGGPGSAVAETWEYVGPRP